MPTRSILDKALKRAFDLTAASAGLLSLAVPLAVVAAAIRLESPGGVFYRGVRVGRHGRPFRIYKFRSMRDDVRGPDTTSKHDPRITKTGAFIRKFKLDELPQLINVIKGEMSIVGPRPEVQWCVDLYTPEERVILENRPGITDWASMKFHNEGEIIAASGIADADEAYLKLIRPDKLRLQIRYAREANFLTDLAIIRETLATLLRTRSKGEGA